MAAIFSVNQVHQLYVIKDGYSATVNVSSPAGTIGGVKCVNNGVEKEVYFLYKGADADTVLRSDMIQVKNINYIKAIPATAMLVPLKVIEVTLDSSVNSGAPKAGQDYVLRINFRQFYGMSDEDQYIKDAVVRATSTMSTAKDLFDAMKDALNLAFSREIGASKTANPYLSFSVTGSGASAKLVITEKIQPYTLGIQSQERVYFDVIPTTIFDGTNDVIWGKATDATPTTMVEDTDSESDTYQEMIPNEDLVAGTNAIGNGTKIADLEYFCMGERGDQYRLAGWPNYIHTDYLVDPTAQYDVLEIHYGFTDTGVNSYRSEKDITIVAPTAKASALNSFIDALETATGFTIAGV